MRGTLRAREMVAKERRPSGVIISKMLLLNERTTYTWQQQSVSQDHIDLRIHPQSS